MKRFFLLVLILFFSCGVCFAAEGISFIYINGSNNNDLKMKDWYENGVKNLHPYLKRGFEQNPLSQKYFLKDGKYFINEKPVIFFWGDKSQADLKFVERNLASSKSFSSWSAYQIRLALTKFLHDAIWVQKSYNMSKVTEDLHESVKSEVQKGNKVVLFGYSAGSFVTYEYLQTRLPFLNVADFFNKVETTDDEKDFISKHSMKDTCMVALGHSGLAVFSSTGHVVVNANPEVFKKNYMHLNEFTDSVCAPPGSVKGIVNFASPLVLFYSDLSDPSFDITYYNKLLIKYIIEKDMFWLTVNYRADPLGFPIGRNLSVEEMEQAAKLNIDPHLGFIYDQSDTWGRNSALATHTSYWTTKRIFSKAVVKAYIDGYRHQYDKEFQKRTLKKYAKEIPMPKISKPDALQNLP